MSDHEIVDTQLGDGSELYIVRPDRPAGAGVLFLHWFDEAPNANRTQFLDEAKRLAGMGVTSALPQLAFPWKSPPTDMDSDVARIEAETSRIREAYDLVGAEGVDKIALVGHDFGAMHGMTLFGEVPFACAVLIAPTPRWADWFLPFWQIGSDRYDYMRGLGPLDPIATVVKAATPLLFQFGDADFYIAAMTARELFFAAPEPKQILTYGYGHAMEGDDIREDRIDFLVTNLELGTETDHSAGH